MMSGSENTTKMNEEKFIKDIKKDFGIKERKNEEDYRLEMFEELDDWGDIFSYFFKTNASKDFNNSNNIIIEYCLNEKKAQVKHNKTFKYKRNNNGIIEKRKIKIAIPAHVKNGQKILVKGEGNVKLKLFGNLVVKINIKNIL